MNVLLRKLGIDAPLGGWLLGGVWSDVDEPETPTFDPPFASGLVNLQRGGSLVTSGQRSGSLVDAERS
jgi:hypothetical protein